MSCTVWITFFNISLIPAKSLGKHGNSTKRLSIQTLDASPLPSSSFIFDLSLPSSSPPLSLFHFPVAICRSLRQRQWLEHRCPLACFSAPLSLSFSVAICRSLRQRLYFSDCASLVCFFEVPISQFLWFICSELERKQLKDSKRAVSSDEGSALEKELKSLFIECSAKTRENVEQCFEQLALKMMEIPSPPEEGSTNGIKTIEDKKPEYTAPPSTSGVCCH